MTATAVAASANENTKRRMARNPKSKRTTTTTLLLLSLLVALSIAFNLYLTGGDSASTAPISGGKQRRHQYERERDDRNGTTAAHYDYYYYVPFPYGISKWSAGGTQFYHTMQCLWTGITASKIDPIVAASGTEAKVRFVVASDDGDNKFVAFLSKLLPERLRRRRRYPQLIEKVRQSYWDIADEDGEDVRSTASYRDVVERIVAVAGTKEIGHDGAWNPFDPDTVCRRYDTSYVLSWYSKYLKVKFEGGGSATAGANPSIGNDNDLLLCRSQQRLRSLLRPVLINRAKSRRIPRNAVDPILQLNVSSSPLAEYPWTYYDDIGPLPLLEQLRIVYDNNLIVLPHGAAEANLMMASTSWQQQTPAGGDNHFDNSKIPTSVIELCPPYTHCDCIDMCPHFYRNRLIEHVPVHGVAFETAGKDCSQFCASTASSNRYKIKKQPIPKAVAPSKIASTIDAVISMRILPMLRDYYCRKASVPAASLDFRHNTTVSVIHI